MIDRSDELVPAQESWVLFTLILGSSLAFLDATVVNVGLPFLQADFAASATGVHWTGDARARAIGTWAGFTSVTMAIRPPLGDYLVETRSWQSVFLMNAPIAAATIREAVPIEGDAPRPCPVAQPG